METTAAQVQQPVFSGNGTNFQRPRPKGISPRHGRGSALRNGLLTRALPIAAGLIGIDLPHALQQFFGIRFLDLRGGGTTVITSTASSTRSGRTDSTSVVTRHDLIIG